MRHPPRLAGLRARGSPSPRVEWRRRRARSGRSALPKTPASRSPGRTRRLVIEQGQQQPFLALHVGRHDRPDGTEVLDDPRACGGGRVPEPADGVDLQGRDHPFDLTVLETCRTGRPGGAGDLVELRVEPAVLPCHVRPDIVVEPAERVVKPDPERVGAKVRRVIDEFLDVAETDREVTVLLGLESTLACGDRSGHVAPPVEASRPDPRAHRATRRLDGGATAPSAAAGCPTDRPAVTRGTDVHCVRTTMVGRGGESPSGMATTR